MSDIIQKPFADYDDWDSCIEEQTSKGHDKESAEKIGGEIKNRTEKEDCPCNSIQLLKSDDGHFYIYGPASVEMIDKERDRIRASALEVSLKQLLRRGRLSYGHQDILVGEIVPEATINGKVYKTQVVKDRLLVLGDIWDDTEASLEAREKSSQGILKSYSISGQIRKGGSVRVCDNSGCYRDVFKLDQHAVTLCEQGMNPEAHYDVIQKADGTIEYITIATPSISIESASKITKEAEVTQGMTETKTQPPKQEAKLKKEDMTEQEQEQKPEMEQEQKQEGGSDIAEMKGMVGQMLEMMKQMMQAMTGNNGGGAEIEAAQKATPAPAPTAAVVQAATEKPLTKSDIELIIKQALAQKAAEQPDGTTPRPAIKKQHEATNSELAEIIKDPSRLEKMSYGHLREIVEGD